MKKIFILSVLSLLVRVNAVAQSNNLFSVQTKIINGTIEGNYNTKTGVQTYFGVPFAKPPIGILRWKAPQPVENWKDVKETKRFGPRPIQGIVFGDMNSRSNGLSEDCLYLNIWTPATRNSKDLPVLLYYFGGGNVAGDGSEPRYDGESMAKKGIVVITCNYRLNIFGFMAHPELSAESPYKASGNYGLLDQSAALKWVYDNIAAFGGNPKKITIAGESAGSSGVSYQMSSPLSRNLLAGAIGESGSGMNLRNVPASLAEAEKTGADFVKNAGYTSIAQMRALSTKEVYELYIESKGLRFPIVLDNYFLPKPMSAIFNSREQAQVPLLVGWNSAEVGGAAFMNGLAYTKENFVDRVKKEYPNDFEEVLKLYPSDTEKGIEISATALASDRFIAYSTWKWFEMHRKNSTQPVYRYLYSKLRPPLVDNSMASGLAGGTVQKDPNAAKHNEPIGAPHACEIEYCMGNLNLVKEYAWTAEDFKVSDTMLNYFANFIKTGNPNDGILPEWTAAKAGDVNTPVMIINTESKTINADDIRYRFLDRGLIKN